MRLLSTILCALLSTAFAAPDFPSSSHKYTKLGNGEPATARINGFTFKVKTSALGIRGIDFLEAKVTIGGTTETCKGLFFIFRP